MEMLQMLAKLLKAINYHYGIVQGTVKYPYWVGEYIESEVFTEDGKREFTVLLNGFTRGKYVELEREKEKIRELIDNRLIQQNKSVFLVNFGGSINIPVDNESLKRQQITIKIQEWRSK